MLLLGACGGGMVRASDAAQGGSPTVYTTWQIHTTRDGLPHDAVRAVRVFNDQVWVGTDGGLALYADNVWKKWTRRRGGLPAQIVSAVDVHTGTRDVWLGTWGDGLLRFTAGRFDRFDQLNSGLAGDLVFSVAVVGNRVWAATNGGISAYDILQDSWEVYLARRADATETAVTSLVYDGENLYAGVWGGGGLRFDAADNRWVPVDEAVRPEPEGRLSTRGGADTTCGLVVGGQALWSATETTVFRRDPGESSAWQSVPHLGLPDRFVTCIASPSSEQLWLGTSSGLRVLADWSNNTWVHFQEHVHGFGSRVVAHGDEAAAMTRRLASAPPDHRIRCITFDARGVWVGTVNGLVRGTNPRPLDALPSVAVDDSNTNTGADQGTGDSRPAGSTRPSSDADTGAVGIALFGPRNLTIALPGEQPRPTARTARADRLAVQLAVERVNALGGFRGGVPFDLITRLPGYSMYGWVTPEDDFIICARHPAVMGMMALLPRGNHIGEAVAFHTELPLVNVAAIPEDLSASQRRNPWVFRCWGDEPRQHRLLLEHLWDQLGHTRIVALRTPGEAAGRHLAWWSGHAESRNRPLVGNVRCSTIEGGLDAALETTRHLQPDVILTWCDVDTSASILRRMREMGMRQLFVGARSIVGSRFLELIGTDPGQILALSGPALRATSAGLPEFEEEYANRNVVGRVKVPPKPAAYRSFLATDHLLEAVNVAGPDREAVRETLDAMRGGATGELHYERLHPTTILQFARIDAGRWVFQTIRQPP